MATKASIVYVPISELTPYANNARTHDKKQIDQIAASIKEFGFTNPVLIDGASEIIAGHGRVLAAAKLKMKQVPCIRLSHLSATQKQAYVIADNRLALNAGWNAELLASELKDLKSADFELDLLGFADDELAEYLGSTAGTEGNTDPDDVPDSAPARAKLGDLWQLGEHRVMCGDSTDKAQIERLMGGEKADMVFTDPPYNHASEDKLVAAASDSKAHADLMRSEWDKDFSFLDVAGSIEAAIAKDATVYVCTSWHLAGQIWGWMATRSSHYSYCVWHKPNPMPSLMKRHWTWASELICYATFGKHTFNFPNEGHASNVWTITKKSDGSHPTMKPVELVEHAIAHSSKPDYRVLDLFLGSGSTLIACEKTGRKCYGMEIDPHYCDVIIKRWEDFTGRKAKKLGQEKISTKTAGKKQGRKTAKH